MPNSNCFFCLEPVTDNYLNVHPKAKFAHLCHTECLHQFQSSTLKTLTALCPLCREPMTYLEDEVRETFPQPRSFKEWMSLIKYFRKKQMAGHEIVIFFFGDNSIYNLPARGSMADLALKKFIMTAVNDFQSLSPFCGTPGWDALSCFTAHYDMIDLGKRVREVSSSFVPRTVSYFLSSPTLFREFQSDFLSKYWRGYFFYSKHTRPSPEAIKMVYSRYRELPDCKWVLQLLEESLHYGFADDWCQWVRIVEAKSNIPFAKFRNCAVMACLFDFVEVTKWLMTNFTLTDDTIYKYFLLAKNSGSVKAAAFLHSKLKIQNRTVEETVCRFMKPFTEFKEKIDSNRHPSSVSRFWDTFPQIKFFPPAQKWVPHHWYVFWNPPCKCYGGEKISHRS